MTPGLIWLVTAIVLGVMVGSGFRATSVPSVDLGQRQADSLVKKSPPV
jgi:hypothetical protein